jgi:Swiss Army Knife RNA repair-like protein
MGRNPASIRQGAAVIVFLDFDGVLHPDPCSDPARLFESAPRLTQVVEEFPEIALVLSTAWRHTHSYEQMLGPLPAALRQHVIGCTPTFGDFEPVTALIPYCRQAECMQWMRQGRLQDEPWLALDDRPSGFTPYCENLITCHPRYGFDPTVSARLRSVLQRHFQGRNRAVDLLIG